MTQAKVVHGDAATETWFAERCWIAEWWNRDDDAAASMARARVKPGVTTRWHRLAGVTERYVVLEGPGRVEVDGLAPQAVGPADVVVIPAGCAQRIASRERSTCACRCKFH